VKKSCFIQAVVIITILVAAAIYIIQYKLDDWFIKPTKNILITEAGKNLESETSHINDSVQKDSLRSLMIYYFKNIKSMKDVVNLDQENIFEEFELVIEDSLITDEEISKLTLLMQKEQNEKSKSNRN
jgi:predicted membrane protein